jgi:hypothetical protein
MDYLNKWFTIEQYLKLAEIIKKKYIRNDNDYQQ